MEAKVGDRVQVRLKLGPLVTAYYQFKTIKEEYRNKDMIGTVVYRSSEGRIGVEFWSEVLKPQYSDKNSPKSASSAFGKGKLGYCLYFENFNRYPYQIINEEPVSIDIETNVIPDYLPLPIAKGLPGGSIVTVDTDYLASEAEVDRDLEAKVKRKLEKSVNIAVRYGMSPERMKETMGISEEEQKKIFEAFKRQPWHIVNDPSAYYRTNFGVSGIDPYGIDPYGYPYEDPNEIVPLPKLKRYTTVVIDTVSDLHAAFEEEVRKTSEYYDTAIMRESGATYKDIADAVKKEGYQTVSREIAELHSGKISVDRIKELREKFGAGVIYDHSMPFKERAAVARELSAEESLTEFELQILILCT